MLAGVGGQHGWANLTHLTFGSELWRRLRPACRAIGPPNSLGSRSARRLAGWSGCKRPAALLRARWATTARCGSSAIPRNSASKKSVVAGERDRPDVARRRAQWTKYQDRVEPERLVFIDETWTRTDMAVSYTHLTL